MGAPAGTALEKAIRPATFIESERLSRRLGAEIVLATETFQVTGSFKFRAAYNFALNVPHERIICASSGNFGQALALSCKLLGKQAIVVMPQTSARVKIEAVREHGATVDLVDTSAKTRAQRVAELAALHPEACVASAYDEDLVIEGNSSLGREIAAYGDFDYVVVPVGGGGLISGIAQGLRSSGNRAAIVGAEPELGNDAARSLKTGRLQSLEAEPETLADGARTRCVGERNWQIISKHVTDIIEIPEKCLVEAVRLLFGLANLKAEPTGALSLAALLADGGRFAGKRTCLIISGGNVDPDVYVRLLVDDMPQCPVP